jgi:hypothetical protein
MVSLEQIKADCPWFFDMKGLIAERPNLIPVGLGNSSTEIDFSVLGDDGGAEDVEPAKVDAYSSETATGMDDWMDTELDNLGGDSSDAGATPATPAIDITKPDPATTASDRKRKAEDEVKPDVKPNITSTTKAVSGSKKTKLSEFASVAAAEEVTNQKRLDLAKAKLECSTKVKVEAEHGRTERARIKSEAKLKYKLEKLRLRTAQQPAQAAGTVAQSHEQGLYRLLHFQMRVTVCLHITKWTCRNLHFVIVDRSH